MNNIKQLKELRRYLLGKYNIYALNFKNHKIQMDLEDIDFVWDKEIKKQLTEIERSRLIQNKYHEKT